MIKRITIRVSDDQGNSIVSSYDGQECILDFVKIQDKIIDDMVELSFKRREKIMSGMILVRKKVINKSDGADKF